MESFLNGFFVFSVVVFFVGLIAPFIMFTAGEKKDRVSAILVSAAATIILSIMQSISGIVAFYSRNPDVLKLIKLDAIFILILFMIGLLLSAIRGFMKE